MGFDGYKHSLATIEKMKNDGRRGRKHTEATKKKMSAWQKGKHHSPDTEIKRGQHLSPDTEFKKGRIIPDNVKAKWERDGEKNPNWRGGVTSKNIIARNSAKAKLWRTAVFERDNYTCQKCGARNGNGVNVYLEADHIKQFAYYPELRFRLSNGRTLCKFCHTSTPTYKNKRKVTV